MRKAGFIDTPTMELYPFRFRDPLSGKWKRARYVATPEEIAARHTEWEIIWPPRSAAMSRCECSALIKEAQQRLHQLPTNISFNRTRRYVPSTWRAGRRRAG